MVQALCQAQLLEQCLSLRFGLLLWDTTNSRRHGHALECRELGQQVMHLKNKTQALIPPLTPLIFRHTGERLPGDRYLTRTGCIEASQQVQQSGFTRARGAHNRQPLARRHRQRQLIQHNNFSPGVTIGFTQLHSLEHGTIRHS